MSIIINSIELNLNPKVFNRNFNMSMNITHESNKTNSMANVLNTVNGRTMIYEELPININKTGVNTIYDTFEKNQDVNEKWINPETYVISFRSTTLFLGVIIFKIKKIINREVMEILNDLINRHKTRIGHRP